MPSPRDYPDEKTAEELNRQYGDLPLEDDEPLQGRRFFWVRLAAILVVLVFVVFSLGSLLRFFPWPALDFLSESRELSGDPVVQELREAVVNIRVVSTGTGGSLSRTRGGTGFNISPEGLIITNRHVLEDGRMIFVLFPGHGIYQVKNWVEYPEADLAAAYIEGKDLPVIQLRDQGLPQPGEEVLVIGNPLGFSRVAALGSIEGYRQINGGSGGHLMEISAPIHPGSSGSPVFDHLGEVVGVVFATYLVDEGEEQRGLCVPLDTLNDFVEALRR